MLPLTLAYTAAVYYIFRGRITDADGYGGELAMAGLSKTLPTAEPTTDIGRVIDRVSSVVAFANIVRGLLSRSSR